MTSANSSAEKRSSILKDNDIINKLCNNKNKFTSLMCKMARSRRHAGFDYLFTLGTKWWGTGVVICLEQDANDLHMVQLMPRPPIISCSSKMQNGLPFWCRLTKVVLEQRPLNGCSSAENEARKLYISHSWISHSAFLLTPHTTWSRSTWCPREKWIN